MATSGLDIDCNTFSCFICLDLLKEPVTLPCGHSYCMNCIKTHWDGEVGEKSYTCPQCRHSFSHRPVVVKNTMLSILMEEIRTSEAPAAPVSPPSANPGNVLCDLCSGTKLKAVKSCLQCLVSYCKEHLQPHYKVTALKKHKLVEPTENLQENLCSVHDEVMKMFCRTDQQCICYLCSVDQHKGHHTVTTAAERAEKQKELQTFQQNILERIKHREKDLDGLNHHLKKNSCSADAAVELCDRSLRELLHLLEKRMSLMKQQVRFELETEWNRVTELQDKVQQEISELKRQLTELDTLSHSKDNVQFLLKLESFCKYPENSALVNIALSPSPIQDIFKAAVSVLRSSLQENSLLAVNNSSQENTAKTDGLLSGATALLKQQPQDVQKEAAEVPEDSGALDFNHLHHSLKKGSPNNRLDGILRIKLPGDCYLCCVEERKWRADIEKLNGMKFKDKPAAFPDHSSVLQIPSLTPTPQCKADYFKLKECFRNLTWDPRSLNENLALRADDKYLVTRNSNHRFNNNSHPLQFTKLLQAVSKERLTGQCYFEVMMLMDIMAFNETTTVAVAYEDIRRDGASDECCFGMNPNSWAIERHRGDHSWFWHNGNRVELSKGFHFSLLGVFVDYDAGILSFYKRVRNTPILIYTVKTTFTRPLVAGVLFKGRGCQAILHHTGMPPPRVFEAPSKMSHNISPRESDYWELDQYYVNLTWDPCSLNDNLALSLDNGLVLRVKQSQNYQSHPSRFTVFHQAVSKEHLTGRCYFEMEEGNMMRNHKIVTIAVAYKNIRRNTPLHECRFGMNDKSWAIECHKNHSVILHNKNRVRIPIGGCAYVGVFVDHDAGILCFYRYQNTDKKYKLVYSFKTTFTQPLVAGAHFEGVDCCSGFRLFDSPESVTCTMVDNNTVVPVQFMLLEL